MKINNLYVVRLFFVSVQEVTIYGKNQTYILKNTIKKESDMKDSYFDGGLLQLIGWTVLGSLITVVTLGICLPWSYTMIYNWEVKHTVIDGRRQHFDGTAIGLFGNWIKWFLLSVITLGIYSFWLQIKLKKWIVSHTYFL